MKAMSKSGKLLVLVPDDEIDESRYARKARLLAESHGLDILFIAMINSIETEAQIRRRLVTLSGIAGSDEIQSGFITSNNSSWEEIIDTECGEKDHLLCPVEFEKVSKLFKENSELTVRLAAKIHFASNILTAADNEHREQIAKAILNWAGILAIIAIGFFVEVDFDNQTSGLIKTASEIVILIIEVVTLWWWNTFVSRLGY